jgi:DNA-binding response OmpR family regulator
LCGHPLVYVADVIVDLEENRFYRNGKFITVQPMTARLLDALVDCFPRPASYDYISARLNPHDPTTNEAIRVHVHKARKATEGMGVEIVNVSTKGYKVGYKLLK